MRPAYSKQYRRLSSRIAIAAFVIALPDARAGAQDTLTLTQARALARRTSPDLVAAREAVAAARGRERQAAVLPNPTVSLSREQTSGGGQSNSQNILAADQAIEFGGLRSARRDVARARREAAEGRLAVAVAQLDFEVARAYALARAADRRAELADQAHAAFTEALRVSQQRLAAGDVSGYANRRLQLEAARYATVRAEAHLDRRAARVAVAFLMASSTDSIATLRVALADPIFPTLANDSLHSLIGAALRFRADLRVMALEAQAAAAESRLTMRERTPVPLVSFGLKTENVPGATDGRSRGMTGFIAGVSVPVPLFDRRLGAMEAADAEMRRRMADTEAQRRRIARDVTEAFDAFRATQEQLTMLAPHLGAESRAALRAAEVAYEEGELTLAEWLDAIRAYREAESSYATLQAEALVRRAALERVVGAPLTLTPSGGDAATKE